MYNLIIYIYQLGVMIASLFNEKVRKMWQGECEVIRILKEKVDPNAQYVSPIDGAVTQRAPRV